jgi:hypothetical protein
VHEMSRRSFLAASGGAVLSAALAARALAATGGDAEVSPLVLSSDLYASPEPQRFVFAIAIGPRYASTRPAQVAFAPPGGNEGTLQDTTLYKAGLPKGRGVYVTDATFDVPGIWNGITLTRGEQVPFAIDVKENAEAPTVGAAAPRAASPTREDRLGVKPICTRRPACALHSVSLSDVVGAGAPVAAIFATPALCASQYCGPVLDELLAVKGGYPGITFVHTEIYRSNRGATLAPTVKAWGIPSEPWLFTIDPAGTIVGRIDGAFGRDEIVQQLGALT